MWSRAYTRLSALRSVAISNRTVAFTLSPVALRPVASIASCRCSGNVSKKVEDVMPITTGDKREELKAELQEAPAVIKSYYDQRIVGCPGGEGEDEHDGVWFWLKKSEPHECS